MVNLVLEERERLTMGGKGRGEIRGESGKVKRVVADAPTTDNLGKWVWFWVDWMNG